MGSTEERNIQNMIENIAVPPTGRGVSPRRGVSRDRSDSNTSGSLDKLSGNHSASLSSSPSSRNNSFCGEQSSQHSDITDGRVDTRPIKRYVPNESENIHEEYGYACIEEVTPRANRLDKVDEIKTAQDIPSICITSASAEPLPPPVVPRKVSILKEDSDEMDRQRHRSNSFPDDLTAFRKRIDSMEHSRENIYEELSELRNSRRGSKTSETSEVPPELPARPTSVLHYRQSELQSSGMKKITSLFPKFRASTLSVVPSASTSKQESRQSNVLNSSAKPIAKSNSVENVLENSYTSISESYTSIEDANRELFKRRRSSDTTRESAHERNIVLNEERGHSNQSHIKGQPENNDKKEADIQEHLMDFNEIPGAETKTNSNNSPCTEQLISLLLEDAPSVDNTTVSSRLSNTNQPIISNNNSMTSPLCLNASLPPKNLSTQNAPSTVSGHIAPAVLDMANNNIHPTIISTQNASFNNILLTSQSTNYMHQPPTSASTLMSYSGGVIQNAQPLFSRGMSYPAGYPVTGHFSASNMVPQLSTSAPSHNLASPTWPNQLQEQMYMPMATNAALPQQQTMEQIAEGQTLTPYPHFTGNSKLNTSQEGDYVAPTDRGSVAHFLF